MQNNTYKSIFKNAIPSIFMMILTSLYGVVDGLFISNLAGEEAFTAVSIVTPYIAIFHAFGFMLATGIGSILGNTLGEKKPEYARKQLYSLTIFTVFFGIFLSCIALLLARRTALLLGASEAILEYCMQYVFWLLPGLLFFLMMKLYRNVCLVAEKNKQMLMITIISGCCNVILDPIFISIFKLDVRGAAMATSISWMLGGIYPLIVFRRERTKELRLEKTEFDFFAVKSVFKIGAAALITDISSAGIGLLYNYIIIQVIGESGCFNYGVISYMNILILGVMIGISISICPQLSFLNGAKKSKEALQLFQRTVVLLLGCGVMLSLVISIFARPIAFCFCGKNQAHILELIHALRLYMLPALLTGVNILIPTFFSCVREIKFSLYSSLIRLVVLWPLSLCYLPKILGADGIWLALIPVELLAFSINYIFIKKSHIAKGY